MCNQNAGKWVLEGGVNKNQLKKIDPKSAISHYVIAVLVICKPQALDVPVNRAGKEPCVIRMQVSGSGIKEQ